jgi:hypothetical protein
MEETGGVLRFKPPKTAQGRRMIALPPVTIKALPARHAAQAKARELPGEGYKPFDLGLPTFRDRQNREGSRRGCVVVPNDSSSRPAQ